MVATPGFRSPQQAKDIHPYRGSRFQGTFTRIFFILTQHFFRIVLLDREHNTACQLFVNCFMWECFVYCSSSVLSSPSQAKRELFAKPEPVRTPLKRKACTVSLESAVVLAKKAKKVF